MCRNAPFILFGRLLQQMNGAWHSTEGNEVESFRVVNRHDGSTVLFEWCACSLSVVPQRVIQFDAVEDLNRTGKGWDQKSKAWVVYQLRDLIVWPYPFETMVLYGLKLLLWIELENDDFALFCAFRALSREAEENMLCPDLMATDCHAQDYIVNIQRLNVHILLIHTLLSHLMDLNLTRPQRKNNDVTRLVDHHAHRMRLLIADSLHWLCFLLLQVKLFLIVLQSPLPLLEHRVSHFIPCLDSKLIFLEGWVIFHVLVLRLRPILFVSLFSIWFMIIVSNRGLLWKHLFICHKSKRLFPLECVNFIQPFFEDTTSCFEWLLFLLDKTFVAFQMFQIFSEIDNISFYLLQTSVLILVIQIAFLRIDQFLKIIFDFVLFSNHLVAELRFFLELFNQIPKLFFSFFFLKCRRIQLFSETVCTLVG